MSGSRVAGGGTAAGEGPAVRIVVADDHQVVRAGFAELLGTQPDFTVVGTAADTRPARTTRGPTREPR